ncbi:MAG: hypothetical protein AB1Z67_03905 [Candidatus Limnocylindrales bacterium]
MSSPEAEPAEGAAPDSAPSTWWQHPDGYEMVLPAGWTGIAVDAQESSEIIDAIGAANPGLGDRIDQVLADTDLRVSAIATGAVVEGKVAPLLLVLAEPRSGRKWYVVKEDTNQRLAGLPGLRGDFSPHQYQLPSAEGVRYDFTIVDDDLGEIRVRSWLFKWGRSAYLVNFVVSADLADGAETDFDAIQDSLQFGA